jgi:Bacterial self-protective colicin-like immunity
VIREKYIQLIQSFLDKSISTKVFERNYLENFKAETELIESELFRILDCLFAAVDSYWVDCEEDHISKFEITEIQLRKEAATALKLLQNNGNIRN